MLNPTWLVEGAWADVESSPTGKSIYAMRFPQWHKDVQRWTSTICEIDSNGKILRTINISGPRDVPSMLNVMSVGHNNGVAFVASRLWGDTVHLFDSDGAAIWTRQFAAVNRVSVANIDGDSTDEILVGTQKGLIAMRLDGTPSWHATLGNVRRAVLLPPYHGPALLAAHLSSDLAVLDLNGHLVRRISASYEVMDITARGGILSPPVIIAIDGPTIRAFNLDGTQLWAVRDKSPQIHTVRLSSMQISPDGRWIAAALKGGLLLVYDASDGTPTASLSEPALNYGSLTWLTGSDGRLQLVAAAAGGLQCLEVASHLD